MFEPLPASKYKALRWIFSQKGKLHFIQQEWYSAGLAYERAGDIEKAKECWLKHAEKCNMAFALDRAENYSPATGKWKNKSK